MKKKTAVNKDKEFLAEIVGWAEKAWGVSSAPVLRRPGEAKHLPRPEPDHAAEFITLRARIAGWVKEGCAFPIEEEFAENKLSDMEIQVVYLCLYKELIERTTASISELMKKLARINAVLPIDILHLLQPSGALCSGAILKSSNSYPPGLSSQVELYPIFLRKAMGYRPVLVKKAEPVPPSSAKSIYAGLCETVIGQEEAKKRVASAALRHLTAAKLNKERVPSERIQKANILIIGPTGTGKTHIARALSNILKVPFLACDATQYTESGYVGMNVEDMLVRLMREAGSSERMENGVIYIDEIDKIAARDSRTSHNTTKDVSGLSVQQELLKLLDGDKIQYTRRNGMTEGDYEFKVGGVLFVAGGAFQGLEEIVKARLNRKAAIGFNGSLEAAKAEEALRSEVWYKQIITEDLIEYGFIPEFIGRFASIVTLDPLNESDVLDILTKPKNSLLSQYQSLLKAAGSPADFTQEELNAVAREAFELKTGARGLKAIMEARVSPLLFNATPPEPQQPGGSKAA